MLIEKIRNGVAAFLPKERYFLVMIVFLSFLTPSTNILLYAFPPDGYTYVGDRDEIMMFTSIMSLKNNFDSPWEDTKIFFTPMNGPPYFVMFFALTAGLLNISPLVLLVIFKYLFTFIILCAVYNIIGLLIKNELKKKLSFWFFLLYNGLGGLVYLFGRLLSNPDKIFSMNPSTPFIMDLPELGTAGGVYAINQTLLYHIVPLATGYLALLFFLKKEKYSTLISGTLLGLTLIFYPIFGFSYALLILLFTVVRFSKENALKALYIYLISAPFLAPWIYSYLSAPLFFDIYRKSTAFVGSALIHSLVISFSGLLVFGLYGIRHKINKKFIFILLVPVALFSLTRIINVLHNSTNPTVISLVESNRALLLLKNLYEQIFVIELVALLVVFKLVYTVIKKNDLKEDGFNLFLTWLLVFFFLSVVSQNSARLVAFLIVPASVVAAEGVILFSKFHRIDYRKIAAIIIILTLPSVIIFTGMRQQYPREVLYPTYYTTSEYNALKFMEEYPQGRVFASREIGSFLPLYSNKKTILAMYENESQIDYNQRIRDYQVFFSNTSSSTKYDILGQYNITYVFFGENEKGISANTVTLEDVDFLRKIYDDSKTKIFIVNFSKV